VGYRSGNRRHSCGTSTPLSPQEALEKALAEIEKNFGKGAAMRLGDTSQTSVDTIPTGSIALDHALGIGGYPCGRIIEPSGLQSGGKTTLALHAVANAQAKGGIAAFIDAEHSLDPEYARKIGVDTDALIVAQPDTGEQGLEIAHTLIRSGGVKLIVIDSVAAMVPRAELEGDFGDSHVGLHARMWSQAMRKLAGPLHQTNTTAILINQIREKIGVTWGSPEITTGGRAIPFYASVRLDVRRIATIKDGDDSVANRVKVKVTKNKLAPPFRTCEFDITFGEGINRYGELVDLGVKYGVIDKAGSWFKYQGAQLAQGRPRAMEILRGDRALADGVETLIRERM
jgi:recombination protein RecA